MGSSSLLCTQQEPRKSYDGITFKSCESRFPGGPVVKNLPCDAGDTGSVPGPGGSHMPRSN